MAGTARHGSGKERHAGGAIAAAVALSASLAAVPGMALAEEGSASAAPETSTDTEQEATGAAAQAAAPASAEEAAQSAAQTASSTASDGKASPADAGSNTAASGSGSQEQQAEAAKPAASSDKGTYEKAGLHELTISYVDESGTEIAASHREALADGESYSVASPEVGGYELADASQATVSGTAAKGSGNVSIKVVYRSTMVTYRVVHERQVGPKSSEYRVAETETLTAPAGTKVTAAAKQYENYECVTKDLTLDVTPDGNATLIIKYDVIVPSYGIYFQTGGSYVAPVTGKLGDAVTAPAAPTKAGYTFAGWDTDGDGKADSLPSTIPDHDITATAVWTPATATYQVRYHAEEQGDEYGKEKQYDLIGTTTQTGVTESATPTARKLDTSKGGRFQYYLYSRETSAKIAGDGSTVVDVFYDLRPVTVRFYVPDDNSDKLSSSNLMETKTLLMYQYFELPSTEDALAFHEAHGGKFTNLYGWIDNQAQMIVENGASAVSPADVEFTDGGQLVTDVWARFLQHVNVGYYRSIEEGVEPGDYSEAEPFRARPYGDEYYESEGADGDDPFYVVSWRVSTSHWDGKDESQIAWGPWQDVSDAELKDGRYYLPGIGKYFDSVTQNVFEVRYARRSYKVTYYSNGAEVGQATHRYEAKFTLGGDIDGSKLTPPAGYVFAGWKTAHGKKILSDAEAFEMPSSDLTLYAVWKHPDVHVTFDSEGGTPVASETVAWDGKATKPADPVRTGYEFGGWYYMDPDSGIPALYPFDLGLESDVKLVAAWRSTNTPATYTVIHRAADGTVLATETGAGTVGQTVTELALSKDDVRRAGYAYVSASGITKDLSSDASENVYEFVYRTEPSFSYTVHFYDEATGLPVAADIDFGSEQALLDYTAPAVKGWHVLFGGEGYLSTREGGQELTFWYERDPEPKTPATPTQASERTETPAPETVSDTPYVPKHMSAEAAVPDTGDPSALAAIVSAAGAALASIGGLLRRRQER
jgi:uncharacterized repeat protein (TIGR02543 family)